MPAVSMIRQKLGKKVFTSYVPASDTDAKNFAEALLPGEYEVLSKVGETGNDNVTDGYRIWSVMIKSSETDTKTYLTFATPLNKTSKDIISALKGKTYNDVKADEVVVINARAVQFSSGSDNNSNS